MKGARKKIARYLTYACLLSETAHQVKYQICARVMGSVLYAIDAEETSRVVDEFPSKGLLILNKLSNVCKKLEGTKNDR